MGPRRLRLFALLLAAPLCAAGQTVSLNTGGEHVRITVGESAVLPADFPKDVPLPESHVLARVQREGASTTLELETPGSVASVDARLREGMQANGWVPAAVLPAAGGQARAWEKDARAVVAWLVPVDAGVRLQLQLRQRR